MYAVISAGGRQERVEVGSRIDVDRLSADEGDTVSLSPVLVVDGGEVLAAPGELAGARIEAKVIGPAKGPKVRGFTYRAKARGRRRFGHRQHYTTVEVTAISGKGTPSPRKSRAKSASG